MLRFHDFHGNNIQIQESGQKAVRNSPDSFCDGITFSNEPLLLGEMYCIGINGRTDNTDWSGALRLGVTTENPETISNLPKYACPDLASREGFWARPVKEELAQDGTRLSFSLTLTGDLQLCVNNHCVGALLTDLPISCPLWLIIDIYGSTQAVQFFREDNIPPEILARGPDAIEAYSKLRKLGTAPLYRGRVFLVGLDCAGKKWLKVALLGESEAHDGENPLEGISCRRWCSINRDGQWTTNTRHDKQQVQKKQNRNCADPIRIESDFDAALARNLAVEILKSQQNRRKDQQKLKSASEKSRTRLSSSDSFGNSWRTVSKPINSASSQRSTRKSNRVAPTSDVSMKMIPPRLIPLVESHLKDLKKRGNTLNNAKLDSDALIFDQSFDDDGPTEITISFWELGGHPDLIPILHPFITGEAVYILVFDLLQELDSQSKVVEWDEKISQFVINENDHYTNLEILLSWINLIYQQRNHPERQNPSVVIVGVNRQNLHSDVKMQESMANLKFEQIRESLRGTTMETLVSETYFAVDTSEHRLGQQEEKAEDSDFVSSELDSDDDVDIDDIGNRDQIRLLQRKVYQLLSRQPSMGQQIPESWVEFEKILTNLVDRGIIYGRVEEIFEKTDGKTDLTTFRSCLRLYHNLGMILFWGHEKFVDVGDEDFQDSYSLDHTVILCIQSFATLLACINSPSFYLKMRNALSSYDFCEDDAVGKGPLMSKKTLKKICDFYDWDVEVVRIIMSALKFVRFVEDSHSFFFIPLLHTRGELFEDFEETMSSKSVLVIFETLSFFPEAVFHKLINHILGRVKSKTLNIKFISPIGFQYEPDEYHQVLVKMQSLPLCQKIRLYIKRKFDHENKLPSPQMCSLVLRDVESSLTSLLSSWFPRIALVTKVPCPCLPVCKLHRKLHCVNQDCIHLVSLSEALSTSVIWCGYKQLNTAPIKKLFSFSGESELESERRMSPKKFSLPMSPPDLSTLFHLRSPAIQYGHRSRLNTPSNPSWLKGASKLLESGTYRDDWRAVGKLLGYKDPKLEEFENTFQASRALLKDWLDTSNNSRLSIEMLCACLKDVNRYDVLEIILESDEEQGVPPPAQVFVSYQWDHQAEVLLIRSQLESSGLTCWMDVGQMGGGDKLYNEIYRGIYSSQVVLCCITPRYAVSESCTKEISLADLLRKPIIPIMVEKTIWPPPGPLALLLSQLVYIDLAGSGGHGGSGKHSDWTARMSEITRRVRLYTSPAIPLRSSSTPVQPAAAVGTSGSVSTPSHHISITTHTQGDFSAIRVVEVGAAANEPSVDAPPVEALAMGSNSPPALFFWGQGDLAPTEEPNNRCCRRMSFPSHCVIL